MRQKEMLLSVKRSSTIIWDNLTEWKIHTDAFFSMNSTASVVLWVKILSDEGIPVTRMPSSSWK